MHLPGVISLTDVLKQMENDTPFALTFVTYDKRRGTSGELIDVENARCTFKRSERNKAANMPTVPNAEVVDAPKTRKPNHWENATRNIILNNRQVRKVHIRLITHFNGKTVLW